MSHYQYSVELTEMAAWYASQGMTLYDALQALFEKYGYYGEKTLNLVMPLISTRCLPCPAWAARVRI